MVHDVLSLSNYEYDTCGNYWSDFDKPEEGAFDDYEGPFQTDPVPDDAEKGDGVVDKGKAAGGGLNPYFIIGGSNQDTYPITNAYRDLTDPVVKITKPENEYLYILDNIFNRPISLEVLIHLFPFLANLTLIFGSIVVGVDASDDESGMAKVEFYIDDSFKETVTTQPYSWEWKDWAFLRHTIKVIAYDKAGNHASANITVWKVF